MSLEATIAENTAAIRDLIAALAKAPAGYVEVPDLAPAPAPKTEKPKAEPAPAAAEKPKAEPKTEPKPEAKPAGVEYAEVQTAILALNKAKGRDVVLEVLGRFGATKGPELDQADWSMAIDALKAAANG